MPRPHPAFLFLFIVAPVCLIALACIPGQKVSDAWKVTDLFLQPPKLESNDLEGAPAALIHIETLRNRRVKAVQQRAGDELRWRIKLGEQPLLSFRPNPLGGACEFRVEVKTLAGNSTTVYSQSHAPRDLSLVEQRGDNLAEVIEVDLGEFAGRRVNVIFSVSEATADTCELAQWASPTLVGRGAIRRRTPRRPNVILIAADTLRTDALGAYGRDPSVTPNLDSMAASSDVWLNAFASCNATNPSFVSLMTGLYVQSHGVFNHRTPLPDSATTLAEILKSEGYETSAVVSVRHLADFSGLRQGFDHFRSPPAQTFAETSVNLAIQQVQEARGPFFQWLHLFDPHTPQNPPAPFHEGFAPEGGAGLGAVGEWSPFRQPGPRLFDPARKEPKLLGHGDLYPGEVAYLDWQLGRYFDFLESRGLLENTLIVFVADHGENLGERDIFFNHVGLFEPTVHVPLFIRWPGQDVGTRYEMLVQHFDIFPTILNFLGIDPPPSDAIDLREVIERGRGRRAVFANHAIDHGEMVRTETHKFYRNRVHYHARGVDPPAPLLHSSGDYFFDLVADPEEKHNLVGQGVPEELSLAKLLGRWRAQDAASRLRSLELSDEDRAQLEALGYAQ